MEIDRIKINVRFSKNTKHGEYKTIEVGAEASIGPSENWEEASDELYNQLAKQLARSFNGPTEEPSEEKTAPVEDLPAKIDEESSPPESKHWCEEHQTNFEKREGLQKTWWSHKVKDGDGGWHKESDQNIVATKVPTATPIEFKTSVFKGNDYKTYSLSKPYKGYDYVLIVSTNTTLRNTRMLGLTGDPRETPDKITPPYWSQISSHDLCKPEEFLREIGYNVGTSTQPGRPISL